MSAVWKIEPDGSRAIEDGDLSGGLALTQELGDRGGHLPGLDLWRGITADDDLARLGEDGPVVLIDAGAVVAYQRLRRIDDGSSRPVIDLEGVDPGARVMPAKIEDRADVGGAKRVKRLVVVADRPVPYRVIYRVIVTFIVNGWES